MPPLLPTEPGQRQAQAIESTRPRIKRTSRQTGHRAHLLAQPFPEPWLAFLQANVYHYRLLSETKRARLQNDARVLIAEKTWEGCRGLTVTDEMQVTIAAQAALMLLGQEHDHFRRVPSILIYPSGFLATDEAMEEAGWLPMAAAGQAVYRGPVILAWDAVLAEGRDPSRGRNIVIHEFAHQLDFVDGCADGTLDLEGERAERWSEVLTAEYDRLRRHVRQGRDTFLGDYAATNKSEFFAVASERFFARPAKLRHYHPALYEALRENYAVDPEEWFAERR
jgi:Mlc titration factor MtfA (ptsG expression regulator)